MRARSVMRDHPQAASGLAVLAALARSLREEAGLSTRQLAARSTLARSTITRLEAAQLRPRRSMLTVLAIGLDPGRPRELLGQLVRAAGDDMAEDTPGWCRYRRRRIRRGLLAGTVPVPADVAARLQLHQSAQALLRPDDRASRGTPGEGRALDLGQPDPEASHRRDGPR